MSVLEEGLMAYLEAQVPAAGKGYPIEVPQDAEKPAWSYQVIDEDQLLSHQGATGFFRTRIQMDVVVPETNLNSDYDNAKAIAADLRTALDGFKGDWSGVKIKYCKTTLSDDWAEIHKLPVQRFDVQINYRLN